MFTVLPPPPRANGGLYTGAPTGGLETNNSFEQPTGPDYQLVVGEGTYVLSYDLHLATPPPHPTDPPPPNNNALATDLGPPTAGTKLSIVSLSSQKPVVRSLLHGRPGTRPGVPFSIAEETGAEGAYGDGNPALNVVPAKGKRNERGKPKNNILKSNSSYLSRVITPEGLQKRLDARPPEGIMAFANLNRSFVWLDLSSEIKTDNLTKALFTRAHVLCHDVNEMTKSTTNLDVVMGFNTSDIMWYEPMSQKYSRLNKNGIINSTAASDVKWIPNKDALFVSAHYDGMLMVFDKEREDGDFVAEQTHTDDDAKIKFRVKKSIQSPNQRTNPVAAYRISNKKINQVAFSPNDRLLAAVADDGLLTIIDYIDERALDVYRSYFGALTCVTWSPDGRYVLTGGQDDLVSVWSIADRTLVARCVGHDSWVTHVQFDPWRCDERGYRFGSVGEDCQLLLWDFSVGILGRPRAASVLTRHSLSRRESQTTAFRLRTNSTSRLADHEDSQSESAIVHPVESRAKIPSLPPVMARQADPHPLCWVGFGEHSIITSCQDGHIREWSRPSKTSDKVE
ncbi:WD40 repeat-like protein [Piedraia hortae CBS 480.64]|uniref:WD40 repeat-like protein n=1 Tax=Piedraia hortae CBS 480.64 TaxID=1314780 RepID=A0A6A7BPF4_9PEZI|nr:WD40 repeat-like protein [Piedraia hortae CBS 480.64]